MRRVVCFGEALIDFLGEAPAPGRARAFLQYAGGAPANVSAAIARLGGDAEFVGMLGADAFGDFLIDSLTAIGAGTRYVRRTAAARTALAFVSLDERGERSFSFYRPPSADLLFAEPDFEPGMFAETAIFHACSNSLTEAPIAAATLAGMRRARAAGALVSFDMNLRPALWPRGVDPAPRVRAALAAAEIIKLSAEELRFLAAPHGDEDAAIGVLWQGPAQLIVVTDGAAPLRWYTRRRRGLLANIAVHAVDTTAAGDAFVGGLLLRLVEQNVSPQRLQPWLAEKSALLSTLRFAAACGALAVTRHGAFAAMPTRSEVQTLLQSPQAQEVA